MSNLLYSLLFALACNLDTVLLAAVFRMRGTRLSPAGALVIAGITTAITVLSLESGSAAARLILPGRTEALGGLVLAAMGVWFLLDGLPHPEEDTGFLLRGTGTAAWVVLAAALGVNNAGAGIAAGVSGLSPLLGGAVNFAVTFFSLALGRWLGRRAEEKKGVPGRWVMPASGVLLILLGALRLFT